jgi:RNA 3'-phosphate cyclase
MIKLSGEYGEGGGSIVRIGLAMSALTSKPFEVDNIRKGRCKGGLKHQHLCGVRGVRELCNAKVIGDELGSSHIQFVPGKIKAQTLSLDIGTAGSMTLLLQSLLLPAIFADKKVRLRLTGGSETLHSQPYDYFANVFLPHLKRFADIDSKILKRGYYPKGGGKIDIRIVPKFNVNNFNDFNDFHNHIKNNVNKINLTSQGKLLYLKGVSHASSDLEKAEVAERQARGARLELKKLDCPIRIRTEYSDTLSTGSGITLWAFFSETDEINFNNPVVLGSDALGKRGKRAELVGQEAAKNLLKEMSSGAAVDHYLADQLIPFMALVSKSSIKTSEISNHCRTNIYVVESFLGQVFSIDKENKIIRSA